MGYTQKVQSHFLACTRLLESARSDGQLHPIFTPVQMGEKNFRPYLRRQIRGNFLDEDINAEWAFIECIRILLTGQLEGLGFSSRKIEKFDIKDTNITVINRDLLPSYEDLVSILLQTGQSETERIHKLEELFTGLYFQGVRVMIFDYGTWIRPHGKDKYTP